MSCRRPSHPVQVGPLTIGGPAPVLIQSMTTTTPAQLAASLRACQRLHAAGCPLVRLSVPSSAEAQALGPLRQALDAAGLSDLPLCADVHFQPQAAHDALLHADKVRINPGNFADRRIADWDHYHDHAADHQRAEGIARRFFAEAKARGRAVRIGVNHGSLADRQVIRHGNTVAAMIASLIEYLDWAEAEQFQDLVLSIKSSDPPHMVAAIRDLVAAVDQRGPAYPLHLGVTEAGSGLEGRINAAVGIGALLCQGLGDTIRVSLTEDPVAEIPVAAALIAACPPAPAWHASATRRQEPQIIGPAGAPAPDLDQSALVRGPVTAPAPAGRMLLFDLDDAQQSAALPQRLAELPPDCLVGLGRCPHSARVGLYRQLAALPEMAAHRLLLHDDDPDPVATAARLGALLLDGLGDALLLTALAEPVRCALAILQATRLRISRAEIISCPTCGRTVLDLMSLAEAVKTATGRYRGLRIGVMGCIVNGPGEMAGADYGLVAAGPQRLHLYRHGQIIRRDLNPEEGVDALVDAIEADGPDTT